GLGPDVRNVVGTDGDFDFHARRHMLAQHVDHASARLLTPARLLRDCHHHILAFFCGAAVAAGNHDVLVDARIFRLDHSVIATPEQTPDLLLGITLRHLDDGGLATTARVQSGFAHQHLIAVEYRAHLAIAQIKVAAFIVRNEKAVAIAMPLHAAANQIELGYQAVSVATIAHHLTIALHGFQTAAQRFNLLLVIHFQLLAQMSMRHRAIATQDFSDELAARDRAIIVFCLAGGERVLRWGAFGHRWAAYSHETTKGAGIIRKD